MISRGLFSGVISGIPAPSASGSSGIGGAPASFCSCCCSITFPVSLRYSFRRLTASVPRCSLTAAAACAQNTSPSLSEARLYPVIEQLSCVLPLIPLSSVSAMEFSICCTTWKASILPLPYPLSRKNKSYSSSKSLSYSENTEYSPVSAAFTACTRAYCSLQS